MPVDKSSLADSDGATADAVLTVEATNGAVAIVAAVAVAPIVDDAAVAFALAGVAVVVVDA